MDSSGTLQAELPAETCQAGSAAQPAIAQPGLKQLNNSWGWGGGGTEQTFNPSVYDITSNGQTIKAVTRQQVALLVAMAVARRKGQVHNV